MRSLIVAPLAFISIVAVTLSPVVAQPRSQLGKVIDRIQLDDFRGKRHVLADLKDKKLVVVAFLGTECPLAKLYAPRLNQLARRFGDQVGFLGVNSNSQDSMTELAAFARRHEIRFPMLKDVGNVVADRFGAQRTPEVYVLDDKRAIRYWGRIDDQFGIGYARNQADTHFLADAVTQLLEGKPVRQPHSPSVGCYIGRIRAAKTDSTVTFSNQISRIFQKRCQQCHREGEIAPFALDTYAEVAGWAETIAEVVEENRMPPWHASDQHLSLANDHQMPAEEKKLILQWVRDGAPEGDPAQLPTPQTFVAGWQLPRKPDTVVPMRATPYRVPATGAVEYQYFIADPKFKEDQWVVAGQLLPGNRSVVHHILVFAVGPDQQLRGGGARGFLFAYVPGMVTQPFPEGMAKRIAAGSRLVFQVHYTPVGTPQEDMSKLGLVLAKDPTKLRHEVKTVSAVNGRLRIPPNDGNHRVTAVSSPRDKDVRVLGFLPHMHLRGKSFQYQARWPDGSKQVLLDVPQYDFNWQTNYRLSKPLDWPAGSRMFCIAHFDNSDENLNNPDSDVTVRWGDQTWNEMMIGYYDIAIPVSPEQLNKPARPVDQISVRTRVLFRQLDKNKDGFIALDEVTARQKLIFRRLDTDNDKKVSPRELELLNQIR